MFLQDQQSVEVQCAHEALQAASETTQSLPEALALLYQVR